MSDTKNRELGGYIDVREFSTRHTTIPCQDCGEHFYVKNSFAYNHDTWYCDDCLPEEIREAVNSALGGLDR